MADSISQVISEIVAGDALTLAQVAALAPAHRGEGVSDRSRAWRWAHAGQRRADGVTIKLETAKLGTQILTSRAALARFMAALSSDASDEATAPASARGPADRRKAAQSATERLARAGA